MSYTGEQKRKYQRQWVAARRAQWFVGRVCVDCGATEDLELDHVDPIQKASHRIWSWSWTRIVAETDKCVVRCTGCHKKKTARDRFPDHGLTRYGSYGCRCDICRAAKKIENAKRNKCTIGV